MYPELCMGIRERHCSEGKVDSEMLPGDLWDQLLVLLASALGMGKMSEELQKSWSYSLCCFQCVFGCMGALRVLNVSYL